MADPLSTPRPNLLHRCSGSPPDSTARSCSRPPSTATSGASSWRPGARTPGANSGIPTDFKQDNHSRSRRGTLRGIHFQTHPGQGKLVRCARGAVLDVVVDLRRGSPTFGEWEGARARRRRGPPAVGAGRVRARLLRALGDRGLRLQVHELLRPGDRGGDPLRRSRTSGSSGRTSSCSTPSATARRRGWPTWPTRSRSRCERRRALRPQPDRDAARRQPAHRAAGVAVRALGGRAVPGADGGPRHRPRAAGLGRGAARRPGGDRARLGRRGGRSSPPGSSSTRRRWRRCGRPGCCTSASARGRRSGPPRRRRTGRCPRAPTPGRACT